MLCCGSTENTSDTNISLLDERGRGGVAYERHCFGAVSGVCIALVLGQNVRLHGWETRLSWAGCLGFLALCVVACLREQLAAGMLAATNLPGLVVYCTMLTRRARQQLSRAVEQQQHISSSVTAPPRVGVDMGATTRLDEPAQRVAQQI